MLDVVSELFTVTNIALLGFTAVAAIIAGLYVLSSITPFSKRSRGEMAESVDISSKGSQKSDKLNSLINVDSSSRPYYTPSSVELSIVVPAYNEEQRIGKMLDDAISFLEEKQSKNKNFDYEIIIVDDGSKDNTLGSAMKFSERTNGRVKVIRLSNNRGKGGAVRMGVLHAQGKLILFADADGATTFADYDKLENELTRLCGGEIDESFPGLVVGSRRHLEKESIAERSFARTVLMYGFHALVYIFAARSVHDTQCGFKLFTRSAAAKLFPAIHIERWAFDVELLFLAEKWKFAISEVCVAWYEVEGSKIVPFWSWLEMGRDLVLIWFRYAIGIWTDRDGL